MNTACCMKIWNHSRDDINLARTEFDKPGKLTNDVVTTLCLLIYSSRNNFGLDFCISCSKD